MISISSSKSELTWSEKSVLITGGTGSFGRAFVDIMQLANPPRKLIIYSRDELKQSEMAKEHHEDNMRYFIGDVRDKERLRRACQGVDIIVHAAALKQVPATEFNPFEAVKTNILGAQNVIDAAIDEGVQRAVIISTNKAVNPINLYGATKLCAEKLFVDGNVYSDEKGTRFSVVRYGNILGSRGSVLPLFLTISGNGPLPVTDSRMTRFCITVEQGVEFVTFSIEQMTGGEVFVPKIPSMSIMDLVKAVSSGGSVEFKGIRPGEKLHETLISEDEAYRTLAFDDFFVIKAPFDWWNVEKWKNGSPVPEGFRYCSNSNSQWLSVPKLREMIDHMSLSYVNGNL